MTRSHPTLQSGLERRALRGRRTRKKKHGLARQCGQSLVEFALIVPVMIILVFGIVDFGLALKAWLAVTNSSREGARVLVLGQTCSQVTTSAQNATKGLSGVSVNIAPATCTGSTGDPMSVTVSYSYNYVTPLGNFIKSIAGPINMTSTTTMRHE